MSHHPNYYQQGQPYHPQYQHQDYGRPQYQPAQQNYQGPVGVPPRPPYPDYQQHYPQQYAPNVHHPPVVQYQPHNQHPPPQSYVQHHPQFIPQTNQQPQHQHQHQHQHQQQPQLYHQQQQQQFYEPNIETSSIRFNHQQSNLQHQSSQSFAHSVYQPKGPAQSSAPSPDSAPSYPPIQGHHTASQSFAHQNRPQPPSQSPIQNQRLVPSASPVESVRPVVTQFASTQHRQHQSQHRAEPKPSAAAQVLSQPSLPQQLDALPELTPDLEFDQPIKQEDFFQPTNVPPVRPSSTQSQPLPQYISMNQIQSMPRPKLQSEAKVRIQSNTQSQPQRQSEPQVLKDVHTNTSRQQAHSMPVVKTEDATEAAEEPDYLALLLSLADEYFEACSNMNVKTQEYYHILATALGCLESALTNFKLPPIREAQLSLRYAQVLYEETDNNDDVEQILTKAIDICERNKFLDLKYAMQLLLCRVLYESRPKAAVKDIQTIIEDVEAFRHTAWEYAFRFQHATFSLSQSSGHDFHNCTMQMEKLGNLARNHGDHAMLAFAAIIEALIHLRSTAQDAVASSQRALAKARALQLNEEVLENPQLMIMMDFLDLSCSIKESNTAQYEQKRKAMQQSLYQSLEHAGWRMDGVVYIPIAKRSLGGLSLQSGGVVVERNGQTYLPFKWMLKEDAEAFGYLLSAVTVAHKNASDGGKAMKFLESGLDIIRTDAKSETADIGRKILECHFLHEIAFLQCSKGQWQSAESTLSRLRKLSKVIGRLYPHALRCSSLYLKGVLQQGTGNSIAALKTFQSPLFSLQTTHQDTSTSRPMSKSQVRSGDFETQTNHNISILAAMNVALIIHHPQHPQHGELATLLSDLERAVGSSQNKDIQASYSFLLSILPENTILKAKQHLGSALSIAQSIGNAQITALTLLTMQEKFFKGVVGEQAIKCAKAASHQVKRWGDPMWVHVAAGIEAECFEVQGMKEEANKKMNEAAASVGALPQALRENFV